MQVVKTENYIAYFDESGTSGDTPTVVVAGLLASEVQWGEFTRNWSDTLNQFSISRFHAREFAPSVGEFAVWRDHKVNPDQRERRNSFLRQLLGHMKLRVQRSVAISIRMSDFDKLNTEYELSESISAYTICARLCVIRLFDWAKQVGVPQSSIRYIFEAGGEGQTELKHQMKTYSQVEPEFYDKKSVHSPPLQAADLFAYEYFLVNRDIFEKGYREKSKLRYPVKILESIPHEDLDWGFYAEDNIRESIEQAGIRRRLLCS